MFFLFLEKNYKTSVGQLIGILFRGDCGWGVKPTGGENIGREGKTSVIFFVGEGGKKVWGAQHFFCIQNLQCFLQISLKSPKNFPPSASGLF